MLEALRAFFDSEAFAPHGFCLLWRPDLLAIHVVSDALIGAAYLSIPLALASFVWRRRDLSFGWMFWCFALFITACGATHFFSIWTLWVPDYGAEALVKMFTAVASVTTAAALWPLIPRALAIPSNEELRRVNAELEAALAALRNEVAGRQRAEEALLQAQKLEALGRLAGGVAHDFNNLLHAIYGNLDLLRKRTQADPTLARLVGNAMMAAERGAQVTQRMLAFSRRQELRPVAVDLPPLLHGMEDLLKHSVGPMVTIEMSFPDHLPQVYVDPNQLELAVLNLGSNAGDAMPGGGRVTISARDRQVGPGDPSGLAPGHYVSLAVTDNGEGMDEATLARVTEPFFTTKGIGKGTGLGLSMVHGLAAQSGGRLVLASRKGAGTTAEIWLPVAELSTAAFTEPAHAE